MNKLVPKRRLRKFPKVSSLPSFVIHGVEETNKDIQQVFPLKKCPELSEIDIGTPPGSPYCRRVPISERERPRGHIDSGKWTPISLSSEDESTDANDKHLQLEEDLQLPLPVTLHKQPSMMNLRARRDQHYQGVRTLKPARVINKAGDRNVDGIHLPHRSARFFKDFLTTLVEEQWRYVLTIFTLSFFCSWVFFAILWYVIAYAHGDLEFDAETGLRLGDGSQPCVRGATTFAGFLLLSVETQVSTGYGEKYPTEECPEAIFLMIIQLTIGLVIDGAMVGIVYVKMTRPPKYADSKFSKKAVICQRDSKLCLIFRVCDFMQAHAIDSKIKAYLFEEKVTLEGERVGKCQQRLKLENNGRVFLIWPQTVCHFIDKNSPLYDMSAKDLIERRFEIVVTMTGISKATGQMTQARTSYLSREIMWGHRFLNIITYDKTNENYIAHIDKLDEIQQVDTALCSAQRLDELIDEVNHLLVQDSMHSFYINENDEYDLDESDEEDSLSGLHMNHTSSAQLTKEEVANESRDSDKFVVTIVDESTA
ncbi:unnamed protein product [Diamesa tonsa]